PARRRAPYLRPGRYAPERIEGREPVPRGGRDRRPGRPLGGGEIDTAASLRPAGAAGRRRGGHRRRPDEPYGRRLPDGAATPADRIRLPVPSPSARVHGAGERHGGADDRRSRSPGGEGEGGPAAGVLRPHGQVR